MLKRVLHAANQVVVHEETHTGKELVIENTVNAPAEVRVRGDSWQGSATGAQLFDANAVADINDSIRQVENNGYTLICNTKKSYLPVQWAINVIENTDYSISIDAISNDNAYVQVSTNIAIVPDAVDRVDARVNNNRKTITFNTKSNTKLSLNVFLTAESDEPLHVDGIMLNIGSTAIQWEPFTGGAPSPSPEYPQDIISVSCILKSTNNGLNGRDKLRESQIVIPELRAIPGTDVRDELVVYPDGTEKIVRRVCKKHFSEFDEIRLSTEKENTQVFWFPHIVPEPSRIECLCTHFISQKQGDVPTIKITTSNSSIYIALDKTDASTLDELKTWIEKNNPYVLYCTEPTEEPLTAAEVQGFLRTHQYHTEIGFEGLDEHLEPEVEVKCRVLGR